jgi:hypothetical protein
MLSTVLILGLGGIARSQFREFIPKKFTISGTIGVANVRLEGFPGETTPSPMTDENGVYRVQVRYNWTGIVTPVKKGYVFDPPSRTYIPVKKNYDNQDYAVRVATFTISGNAGAPAVVMAGLPGNPVADAQGTYRAQVDYGWAGIVAPRKEGLSFTPGNRTYHSVEANISDETYVAEKRMVTISSVVKAGNEPIQGVRITAEPGGYTAETDAQGRYKIKVPPGWSGELVFMGEFEPPWAGRIPYTNVISDIGVQETASSAQERMVTISNVLKVGNEPVQGVTVIARPGGYAVVTGSQGRYSLKVPYGWSGSLSFSKPDLEIDGEVQYRNVTADITDRKSISPEDEWPPFPSGAPQGNLSVPAGKILVIPTTQMTADAIAAATDDLQTTLQALRRGLCELRDQGGLLDAGRSAEALYLQGTAVVFTVEMGLAPSPRTWAMVFERFKDELLRSLRHAAGLRSIDPNELVILTLVAPNGFAGQPVLSTTSLTMQAKKSDIDAFARGVLDFDQFRRRVKSFTY